MRVSRSTSESSTPISLCEKTRFRPHQLGDQEMGTAIEMQSGS